MPATRPDLIDFSSVAELYRHYERLFLHGNDKSHTFPLGCDHVAKVFDHNFFHMVKLKDPEKLADEKLLMSVEKEIILATTDGFGKYTYDRQRAIYLASARDCFLNPNEVWKDQDLETADWIYIKEYDTRPYRFTVLLTAGPKKGVAPVTSFPVRAGQIKKWRRGTKVWPQNSTATCEGGG